MKERRVVGLDLGIASAHTAVVLRADGTEVCRRRCSPTVESFAELERAALEGAAEGTGLEIVVEPTGPAWLPVAVFFGRRDHPVYRVPSAMAADLRRFLSRHAKSNSIDAATLARLALVDPGGLRPVELPGADRASLDRRVRAADRLTRAAAKHKGRIKDLVGMLMPACPLTGDISRADLAVLERYADPNVLLRAGEARLTAVIAKASRNLLGAERAEQWLAAARASVELYAGEGAVAFADLAAEVATEVRLLRAVEAELALHAGLPQGRPRGVGPVAARRGRGRRPGAAGRRGQGAPVREQFAVQELHRAYSKGLGDRGERKGRPAHVQGGVIAASHAAASLRPHGPNDRSPARSDLLHADGRARSEPPQSSVRGRFAPGGAGVGGARSRDPLRAPGHRR